MRTRVAIYTRISTDEEHQPYSLEAQQQRLAAYVESQDGWEVVCSYQDQMSGSTVERPDLKRALLDARAARFDLLLVYRVDRLSRSVRGLAQILEDLQEAGVVFRSATEPFDTASPAGRMMVQMLGVFAEFERATIIDRVVAGMERKAARGGWNGGIVPFGYRLGDDGRLLSDPDEAPGVQQMFELYLKGRLGAVAIGRRLAAGGFTSRRGRPFSPVTVLKMLRNPTYTGEIHFRGRRYEQRHDPLVSREVFDAVQDLLVARGDGAALRATNGSVYLLGGLVRCLRCGGPMLGTAARGRSRTYRYYTCYTRQRYGRSECGSARLPAPEADHAVLTALAETFSNSELIEAATLKALAEGEGARGRIERELNDARKELSLREASLERYFNAFESGTLSAETCAPRIEELGRELRKLRSRVSSIEAELMASEAEAPPRDAFDDLGRRIAGIVGTGTQTEQKALAQALVAEVRVGPDSTLQPLFQVPVAAVRELYGVVDPRGFEPLTS